MNIEINEDEQRSIIDALEIKAAKLERAAKAEKNENVKRIRELEKANAINLRNNFATLELK